MSFKEKVKEKYAKAKESVANFIVEHPLAIAIGIVGVHFAGYCCGRRDANAKQIELEETKEDREKAKQEREAKWVEERQDVYNSVKEFFKDVPMNDGEVYSIEKFCDTKNIYYESSEYNKSIMEDITEET